MLLDQRHHVRALPTCPNCGRPKDKGLLVCWPCHREQKRRNDGGYSLRLTRKLDSIEKTLANQAKDKDHDPRTFRT